MITSLFDEIKKTYNGPANYSEPSYDYLNRSNRKEFIDSRDILDKIYMQYLSLFPEEAKDIRKRFQSKDDEHHLGALTELYIFNLLLLNNFSVKPHPHIKDNRNRPEFIVYKDGEPIFYIEATLVFKNSDKKRIGTFESIIFDALNEISSPCFLISPDILSRDINKVPTKKSLTKNVTENLKKYNYDEVCRVWEEKKILPEWEWQENSWKIKFTISPVKEELIEQRRTGSTRCIGAIQYPVKCINLDEKIKNKVENKINKYKKLDLPLILAVNIVDDSIFCDEELILEALFGKLALITQLYTDGTRDTKCQRNNNGIFIDPRKGLKLKKLSGILFLKGLSAFNTELVKPILWHHPQPNYQFNSEFLKIQQVLFETEGNSLRIKRI